MSIGEALLDQRALAGIGNIWKNETLWTERVSPFATVGALDDETVARLVATARRLLLASAGAAPGSPAARARATSTVAPAGRAHAAGR